MNLTELLTHLRCEVLRDTAVPQLWSDTALKLYLNQAQADFARRTHCLVDDTSDFTTFDTIADQDTYAIDSRILAIQEAGVVLDPGEAHASYHQLHDRTRGQQLVTFRSGRPVQFTPQCRSNAMRFAPTPDDVYEVRLVVARKPLNDMEHKHDVPEIDEDYHLALCDYAAWRALSNNDVDGTNNTGAAGFRSTYDLAVRDAKRDIARLRSGPYPQARANWTGKRLRGR